MYRFLPEVQQLFPACGLTVFNVWDLPFMWWAIYVTRLQKHLKDQEA